MTEKYIIYTTESGTIKGTPESNYNATIQDERLIHDLSKAGFETPEEAKEYLSKYSYITIV